MKELETLLSMELDENVKELLNAVNSSYTKLNEANAEMVKTIESKERANAESFEDRKRLKQELQEAKENANKTDDKTMQQKLEALNAEWNEKYQALASERDTIKTDMLNKTKFDEFNGLNIAKLFPKEFNEAQTKIGMDTIQNTILNGTVFDESSNSWVYKENGVTRINPTTGKPFTISDRFAEVRDTGAFNMFIAGNTNSGGGTNPNGSTQTMTPLNKDMSYAEKAKAMQEMGSEAYLKSVKK